MHLRAAARALALRCRLCVGHGSVKPRLGCKHLIFCRTCLRCGLGGAQCRLLLRRLGRWSDVLHWERHSLAVLAQVILDIVKEVFEVAVETLSAGLGLAPRIAEARVAEIPCGGRKVVGVKGRLLRGVHALAWHDPDVVGWLI